MKKWNNPELKNLNVQNTKDDGVGYNFPHYVKCKKCGKHHELAGFSVDWTNLTVTATPDFSCVRCGAKGLKNWELTCDPEVLLS